jgi:HTH-type transcriptional repressor of NAD biosynthesis genes
MKTQNKAGLYVGKFVAYHQGHQYYINKFARSCDLLHLVLCVNTKTDLTSFEVRKNWLTKDLNWGLASVREKIKFHISFEDKITPYPDGIHEWCKWIEDLTQDKIDIIFGNDDYVKQCASILGAEHYSPDFERKLFNISSTKIIKSGLKYYDYLTEVAKPYFNKKILITGVESAGKSTLCRKLALHFNMPLVEEYGRKYEEQSIQQYNLRCTYWKVEDYEVIAETQNKLIEDQIEKPGNKLVFIDTDAMITEMYCELYLKKTSEKLSKIISNQNFDLIIFLDHSNTEWVNDGIRFMESQRNEVSEILKKKMRNIGREYIEIKNDKGYDFRFEEIIKLIESKFNIENGTDLTDQLPLRFNL